MNTDLLTAMPALMVIGAGVGLVALFRDRADADQHDVSDYHEPAAEPDRRQLIRDALVALRQHAHTYGMSCPVRGCCWPLGGEDILPPAPAGMNAGCPLYAEALFASWRTETPAQTAARFLRELGDEAKTQPRELVPA